MITVIISVVALVFAVIALMANVRYCAINSIGELRYMLRCSKERYELYPTEEEAEYIKYLEARIKNHWGRKLVRKNDRSIFDNL